MKKRSLFTFFVSLAALIGVSCFAHAAAEAPKPLVVMPLGDSITQGTGAAGGYRSPLCTLLADHGWQFRFVGSQAINSTSVLDGSGNAHHEGHGGYALSHILNNLDGGTSNGGHWLDGLPGVREAVYPDVILLMIGTNDLGSHKREVEPTLADYDRLLGKLAEMRPDALVIASTLIPYTGSTEKYPLREQHQLEFNAALPELVAKHRMAGHKVVLHDMRAFVRPEHISADGVHPNQSGHDALAAGWFDALKKAPLKSAAR